MISGAAEAQVTLKDAACCAFGILGVRDTDNGYDCIMIPGATKAAFNGAVPVSQCGQGKGLISMGADTPSVTVCCKYSKDLPTNFTEFHSIRFIYFVL